MHRLVLPEDLNQFGHLFGGRLLAWVDEAAWIQASLDYPDARLVTVGMDEVAFSHGVTQGTILTITSTRSRLGTTSLTYLVTVTDARDSGGQVLFSTHITFVNLDKNGKKKPLVKSD